MYVLNTAKKIHDGFVPFPQDFVYKMKKKDKMKFEPNIIRETMRKGYEEMSQINLMLASESIYLEYEAQHTSERFASGG